MRSTMRGTVAALAVLTTALTGCSKAEDKAKQVVGDAACSVAAKAVGGVKSQADSAIDQIGADPQAAEKQLSKLRDVVKAAEDRVGGGVKDKLADAREALEELAGEAADAADGKVDTSAINSSKQSLADAIDGVSNAC